MAERKIEYQKVQRGKSIGLRVEAPSLQRVFIDAALAFFDRLSTGSREMPDETLRKKVEISAPNPQALLIEWAKALRKLYLEEKFIGTRAVFEKFDGKILTAVLHGSLHSPMRHGAYYALGELEPEKILLSTDGPSEKMFSAEIIWQQ